MYGFAKYSILTWSLLYLFILTAVTTSQSGNCWHHKMFNEWVIVWCSPELQTLKIDILDEAKLRKTPPYGTKCITEIMTWKPSQHLYMFFDYASKCLILF